MDAREHARLRILLLGDGPHAGTVLRALRARMGTKAAITHVEDADRAEEAGMAHDLVILALPLQCTDGPRVCRRLRDRGLAAPLLILGASDRIEDIVAGLEAGADDYLVWTANIEEVRAHISALVRRQGHLLLA